MKNQPRRSKDYLGPVTDTRIWDRFDLRSGDVVLSTPPKCGTTWSQAILMMLIHGAVVTDRQVWRDSFWIDCGFRDQQLLKTSLDAQTHRRCIKSHTPFDGITFDPDVVYISVYRHPIDVHLSMLKHIENLRFDILDFLSPAEPGAAFERFLSNPANDTGTDDLTLEAIFHHYRSFAAWEHMPNVHLFHYADLSKNLPGMIRRYADATGLKPAPELVSGIAKAASFGAMKEITKKSTSDGHQGAFHTDHKFFDSATSNKWEGRLSAEQMAEYKERFEQIAGKEDIEWLENGGPRDGS